ncbi:hypothetical protein N0V83_006328 [Neocucurbitaria cava]|uniref:Uncharacterized protein n=1 Tax=Neocucurbitaria cava TaxID=798079 RepID=A0A9W8Y6H7_9PLEO|nr:hypothetical protein N0V83_006328 [Neocucurbitaria cava]
MDPPMSPQLCAFGRACGSRAQGREEGPSLCVWCKNMSFPVLDAKAETLRNPPLLRGAIEAYEKELKQSAKERTEKKWMKLCACKDPKYRNEDWRRYFNPNDERPCSSVEHRGQLCTRCYRKARDQSFPWLKGIDGDRIEYPCIWQDPDFKGGVNEYWRQGPIEKGLTNVYWKPDPTRVGEVPCTTVNRRKHLCSGCFNRMNVIKNFGKFFDNDSGVLQPTLGL